MDKWNLQTACECLIRNGGKANPYEKKVSHPKPGIKILGAIDYLIGQHRFMRIASDEPIRKRKEVVEKEKSKVIVIHKRKKKLED